jgi:hypothetical protein
MHAYTFDLLALGLTLKEVIDYPFDFSLRYVDSGNTPRYGAK